MNGLEYNHQVFILNGQPVIIQRNEDSSTTGIINDNGTITLSQESHSSINEANETSQFDVNRGALIQETDTDAVRVVSENQFVAYVGDSDEDDVPTIHITLEQAAELGLQFDNEEMKLDSNDLPIVSENQTVEDKQILPFNVFPNKNTSVNSEDLELTVFSDRKILGDTSVCDNISDRISKDNVTPGEGNFKIAIDEAADNLNLDGSDQQITLIPHFANGTITYSVQVNNSSNIFTEKQTKNEKKINLTVPPKTTLQISDFDAAAISASNYANSTLKTFTACSDLSPFVESNLDISSSQQSINSTEMVDAASQNVIGTTNEGNISFTSHTLSDCVANKSSSVNFTPLSDLLKCSNIINGSKSSNQNNLASYQPISLTHLINSINKNQNPPQLSGKVLPNASLKTNVCATSSNNTSTINANCKVPESGGAFNTKNKMIDKTTLLKNRPTICTNSLVLSSANINIIKTTLPTGCDSVLVPIETNSISKTSSIQTLPKLPDNLNCQSNINNGLTSVANGDTSKSVTAVMPLIRSQTILNSGVSCQNNTDTITKNSGNAIGFSSISTSSDNFESGNVNHVANSCKNASSNQSTIASKNEMNISSPITERLSSNNDGSNECSVTYNNQLPSSDASVMASTATLTLTSHNSSPLVNASTSAPSTVCSTSTAVMVASTMAATREVNTSSVATSLPTVSSIRSSDNKVVLPKEVTAALNLLPPLSNANKPLGSSENPIQLIQQGQTFHSAQVLTADQLKQVTTVLQQNNLGHHNSVPAKNILYDAETNTRIIYRVVYPEEFDLKEASRSTDDNGKTRKRGRPSLKSSLKDSAAANVQDENTVVKRKQPLPRTRSGRLSRPPRYMVRDYKRIKRSELDDSDGAYSDYQSEHEDDNTTGEKNLLPGLLLPQKRNISSTFRCPTCDKIYLGYRRMAHHFDKYSDHGTEEYLLRLKKACENKRMPYGAPVSGGNINRAPNNSLFKTCDSTVQMSKPVTVESDVTAATIISSNTIVDSGDTTAAITSLRDSVTVTNSLSTNLTDDPVSMNVQNNIPSSDKCRTVIGGVKVGANFGRRRGRRKIGKETSEGAGGGSMVPQQLESQLPPEQIKTRLRELLELCNVSELVQVAGPAVCSVLTTWELLLLRVDSMCTQQNRVTALCDEIKLLLSRFKELASSLFQPVDNVIKNNCTTITFEMEDKVVSSAFGLPCGRYKIDESVLKTEQIINACRSKQSPTGWEEQQVVNNKSVINDKEHPSSPVIDMDVVEGTDTSLNVFSKSENSMTVQEEEEEDDNRNENSSESDMTEMRNDRLQNHGVMNEQRESISIPRENAVSNDTTNLSSGEYMLANDSEMLCEERNGLDDSVEQIVNEQLKNLTSQNQELSKVEVDELMKDFSVLEHRHGPHNRNIDGNHDDDSIVQIRPEQSVVLDPSDDLMDGFTSITDQRNHVSASTEDLIKSLENFSSELHNSTCDDSSRQDFMNGGDNFSERVVGVNNVNVVDALDFDVLSQDFHHSNSVSQR